MSDSREGDLNLIQLQKVTEIDISKVAQIFVISIIEDCLCQILCYMIPIPINQCAYHTKLILLY